MDDDSSSNKGATGQIMDESGHSYYGAGTVANVSMTPMGATVGAASTESGGLECDIRAYTNPSQRGRWG